MNNVEKRLQAKVRREEASEQRKQERKSIRIQKKIQRGTKRIYYTILKKVIKNKEEEDVRIYFNEFLEFDTSLPCLGCIQINGERVFLGKTYFDLDELEKYLEVFNFSITRGEHYHYSSTQDLIMQEQLLFLYGPIRKKKHSLTAIRSEVCHKLLTLQPQNHRANTSPNNDGPTLTKK